MWGNSGTVSKAKQRHIGRVCGRVTLHHKFCAHTAVALLAILAVVVALEKRDRREIAVLGRGEAPDVAAVDHNVLGVRAVALAEAKVVVEAQVHNVLETEIIARDVWGNKRRPCIGCRLRGDIEIVQYEQGAVAALGSAHGYCRHQQQ